MKKKCIYACEFVDNNVYIGLTNNIKNRKYQHKKYGTVYEHSLICENYNFKQLTKFIDPLNAKKMENFYVNKYKNGGWNILNKTGTGSLGGNILKWTKEKCHEEALKYKYKIDFQKNAPGCYKRCRLEGWLDELTQHMKNAKIKWTKENCLKEAKKYKTYSDYMEKSASYRASAKYGFLNSICDYFNIEKQKHKGYWTKEKCREEALKYNYLKDFRNSSNSAYCIMYKNNWFDELTTHMTKCRYDYWTKEKCHEEALKYKYMKDFQKYSGGAYYSAFKNNWLIDISKHMNYKKRKGNNHWTKENCLKEALKYNKKMHFVKNASGAYKSARKNKWLDEICSHMN